MHVFQGLALRVLLGRLSEFSEINTLAKVKQYLKAECIAYDKNETPHVLFALAKRRVMRKLREAERKEDPLGRTFRVDQALSLAAFKNKITYMRDNVYTDKLFLRIKFIVDDFSDNMTIVRCSSNINDCRGRIINDECAKCGRHGMGVLECPESQ